MKFTRFVYAMTVEIHAIRICDDRVEPGGGARDDATVTGSDVRRSQISGSFHVVVVKFLLLLFALNWISPKMPGLPA